MDYANLTFFVLLLIKGVLGVEPNSVKTLEVTEGDPVFLDSCVTEIQKDDKVVWKFGSRVIATIASNSALLYDTDDGIFAGKLQVNDKTGDLIIRNPRPKHSGVYEVKITSVNSAMPCKTFRVAVLDAMPTEVSVKVGEPVILQHNISDVHMYDVIEWMFEDGKTAIARINKQISKNPSYDEKNEKFKGRLALDQTGYLTIADSKTTDSGLYKLEVIGTNLKGNRNFRVIVSEPGLSTVYIVIILVVIVLIVVAVLVAIKCRINRKTVL
nr:uncharacterized protein si:dkey-182g1.2 isoform X2 [Danio rerio]|eukprot:XP_009294351.1 uncharacterized protein si:dkey-182g1.2 isoform X2 [Danio rerio]